MPLGATDVRENPQQDAIQLCGEDGQTDLSGGHQCSPGMFALVYPSQCVGEVWHVNIISVDGWRDFDQDCRK